jgi:4-carboxymuconolactone decarboxylase
MAESRYETGLKVRTEVLGHDHVARAMDGASMFSRPMQELVIEYCWGTIWSRPGLARRERSLINLAMITALNRPHELAVHVRGAITNGCTVAEIQEVLLQASIYCGVPAGLDAFRIAETVLREIDGAGNGSVFEDPALDVGEAGGSDTHGEP